jgi:tetratricopeptide (TPR) repeat protein
VTYYLNGQEESSLETMKKLIQINPSHADALNFVGYTYAERGENLDEAEALVKRALELTPNKGYILDSLGWVYYKQGRYDEAIEQLNRAAALEPDDPAIMEHLGDVYVDKGEPSKALDYYQRGLLLINRAPDNPDEELKERLNKKTNDLKESISVQN